MYQGAAGQVSRDEYLMGRTIDKQITDQYAEPESGPSAETGLLPGSIFNPATPASNLDLAAKIREDPLFEIRWVCLFPLWFLWKAAESHTINIVFFIIYRKREEEKKREVLTNPVKMKKIKEMVKLLWMGLNCLFLYCVVTLVGLVTAASESWQEGQEKEEEEGQEGQEGWQGEEKGEKAQEKEFKFRRGRWQKTQVWYSNRK